MGSWAGGNTVGETRSPHGELACRAAFGTYLNSVLPGSQTFALHHFNSSFPGFQQSDLHSGTGSAAAAPGLLGCFWCSIANRPQCCSAKPQRLLQPQMLSPAPSNLSCLCRSSPIC